jgi:hypothetical protein
MREEKENGFIRTRHFHQIGIRFSLNGKKMSQEDDQKERQIHLLLDKHCYQKESIRREGSDWEFDQTLSGDCEYTKMNFCRVATFTSSIECHHSFSYPDVWIRLIFGWIDSNDSVDSLHKCRHFP